MDLYPCLAQISRMSARCTDALFSNSFSRHSSMKPGPKRIDKKLTSMLVPRDEQGDVQIHLRPYLDFEKLTPIRMGHLIRGGGGSSSICFIPSYVKSLSSPAAA
jgi:hypothetical protein